MDAIAGTPKERRSHKRGSSLTSREMADEDTAPRFPGTDSCGCDCRRLRPCLPEARPRANVPFGFGHDADDLGIGLGNRPSVCLEQAIWPSIRISKAPPPDRCSVTCASDPTLCTRFAAAHSFTARSIRFRRASAAVLRLSGRSATTRLDPSHLAEPAAAGSPKAGHKPIARPAGIIGIAG
jgi:hypothetical protein